MTRDEIELEECQASTRLLIAAARRRGLQVHILDGCESLIEICNNDHREMVFQATMTRLDNYASFGLLQNKAVCKQRFVDAGIPTPLGVWGKPEEVLRLILERIEESNWVVKPNVQYQGTGISFVKAGDVRGLRAAIEVAARYSRTLVIEHWIDLAEYRFLSINGRVHSVLHRIAPHVIGDGVSSIAALIEKKNLERNKSGRSPEYNIRLEDSDLARLLSRFESLNSVPESGERIQLRFNSNVHTGGDCKIQSNVHSDYLKLAAQVSSCLDACIVGIDILVRDIESPLTRGGCYVLEANFNPDISIHATPTLGQGSDASSMVLDALGL